MVRDIQAALPAYTFAARFDVASYYETISHEILLSLLEECACPPHLQEVVRQYLTLPDMKGSGVGLSAGGSISPLLGALYLHPLDAAFAEFSGEFQITEITEKTGKDEDRCLKRKEWVEGNAKAKAEKQVIFYRRFMDDFVILTKTRRQFRKAIRLVHHVLRSLRQQVHTKKKCFIGRTVRGFDMLGYRFCPGRKLRPSAESVHRMLTRARRLYEHGASEEKLWQYVSRWCIYLWGGVYARVSMKGGVRRYCVYVAKELEKKYCDLQFTPPTGR